VATPEHEGKIRLCFLYKNDVNDILTGMRSSVARNDWVIKNTKQETTFLAIAKMVSHFGNHIKMEAKQHNLKAFDMDFDFRGGKLNICLSPCRHPLLLKGGAFLLTNHQMQTNETPNHALQRTRHGVAVAIHASRWAGSLSLGR
jgi:hypothetical protein